MYNTKVVCTYNTPEVFLETDDITDDEKAFVRDIIYRQELLDILNIDYENEDNDNDGDGDGDDDENHRHHHHIRHRRQRSM
jgi:hypothetical protein